MMGELKIIDERVLFNKDFRIYGTEDNPLFLAKDVANWIEHSKTSMMLNSIDEEEKLRETIFTSGQNREVWLLTEDGLYEVLMQSRKPIAKQFKKEVKKILKAIRKSGGYVSNTDLMINTYFGALPDEQKLIVKGLFVNIEEQQKQLLEKDDVIEKQKPKVKIYDQIADATNLVSINKVAKSIGVGERKLFLFLREIGILYKEGTYNIPYQQHVNNGHFQVKITTKETPYGVITQYITKVTGKGEIYILNKVNKFGGGALINNLKLNEISDYVAVKRAELKK